MKNFGNEELRHYELNRGSMNKRAELFSIRCLLDSDLTKGERARLEYRRKKLTGELTITSGVTKKAKEIIELLKVKRRELKNAKV